MEMSVENIVKVGVEDRQIDLFEGMYKVPDGVTYNSYVVIGEKIAVIDSVDAHFSNKWLANIDRVIGGKSPDYLIVQHMEPDHSGSVDAFVKKYPDAVVVGNSKTMVMLGEYFGASFPKNTLVVKDGETLDLGGRMLKFIFAPMVHWPEVMFTYDEFSATLFSADAFGSFGIQSEGWDDEARRYYIGIVGKYGVQVTNVLKKVLTLKIDTIAPLHGQTLCCDKLVHAIDLYTKWAGYQPETEGVLVAYSSVYGHTKVAAELLYNELTARGVEAKVVDLARDDWSECVAQAFKYSKLVVATTTYNAAIFPAAREFIDRLIERNYKNRTVAFIENGTWAPVCAKLMRTQFEACKDITFAQTTVKIHSALSDESRAEVIALAQELSQH
ncbi:MAG: FprA family A-type flavoprotein [Candidatus Coproplasma sp.]